MSPSQRSVQALANLLIDTCVLHRSQHTDALVLFRLLHFAFPAICLVDRFGAKLFVKLTDAIS
jgi:hypothetical protein